MYRTKSRRAYCAASLFAISVLCRIPGAKAATYFWKQAITNGTWSNGANWSAASSAGSDNAGVPGDLSTVNITLADGISRTITYDYTGPAVTVSLLQIDLNGGVPGGVLNFNMT